MISHSAPLIIDMVHHNPGERPFETVFNDPLLLKSLGYNGQCFKHLNTVMRFPGLNDLTSPCEEECVWLDSWEETLRADIAQAKRGGLEVFFHLDLFVLPKRIMEVFASEMTDPASGLISVRRPKTLELHRLLFDEMFARFPEVSGIIPRIGETYLFDTPYHYGNGAVVYSDGGPTQREIEEFILLLQFLREEICEKHDRYLIHRTWDIQNDRFHSNKDFYLAVTDAILPHQKLRFSIKHSHIDFHRYARWNPCLGLGRHRQLVEVQCQREYEGKGAYPNFSSSGVVDGFPEMSQRVGLRSFVENDLYGGIFSWSRGGGWHGPYIGKENEFWIELNVRYLLKFLNYPSQAEELLFKRVVSEDLAIQEPDAQILYRIAKLSLEGVLHGKCCAAWDARPEAAWDRFPTNQWMRDDVLGGWDLLEPVFQYLHESSLVEVAIKEKFEAVRIWRQIVTLSGDLRLPDHPEIKAVVAVSCEYGLGLFSFIAFAWQTLLLAYERRQGVSVPLDKISQSLETANLKWGDYVALSERFPECATFYELHGWYWPRTMPPPGIGTALAEVGNQLRQAFHREGQSYNGEQ